MKEIFTRRTSQGLLVVSVDDMAKPPRPFTAELYSCTVDGTRLGKGGVPIAPFVKPIGEGVISTFSHTIGDGSALTVMITAAEFESLRAAVGTPGAPEEKAAPSAPASPPKP